MNTNITIRHYAPEDLESVIEVFLLAIKKTASNNYNDEQITAWAQVDKARWGYRMATAVSWVAALDGQIVGFASLETPNYLDLMFVRPTFIRQGIATCLLKRVEKTVIDQGEETLKTHASITAKPFFEKNGFMLIQERQVEVRGAVLTHYAMKKQLGNVIKT